MYNLHDSEADITYQEKLWKVKATTVRIKDLDKLNLLKLAYGFRLELILIIAQAVSKK